LADDVGAGGQAEQRVAAGGIGLGGRVAGHVVADASHVDVDLDVGQSDLAVVLDTVAVGVIENGAGDGDGGGMVAEILSTQDLSGGDGYVLAPGADGGL